MKVYIGPHTNFIGPYQLAEKILFWLDTDSDVVYNFGNRLSKIRWIVKLCNWLSEKRERKVNIRIDKYDTWNMDDTLTLIIVPMLKQLKVSQHGAPHVEDRDVPKELRRTSAPAKENDYDVDDNHFKRWDWVLDEMIFAFENLDNTDQFYSGETDYKFIDCNDGTGNKEMITGPNHTYKCDEKKLKAHEKRVANGLRLFGVYYRGLWD